MELADIGTLNEWVRTFIQLVLVIAALGAWLTRRLDRVASDAKEARDGLMEKIIKNGRDNSRHDVRLEELTAKTHAQGYQIKGLGKQMDRFEALFEAVVNTQAEIKTEMRERLVRIETILRKNGTV